MNNFEDIAKDPFWVSLVSPLWSSLYVDSLSPKRPLQLWSSSSRLQTGEIRIQKLQLNVNISR